MWPCTVRLRLARPSDVREIAVVHREAFSSQQPGNGSGMGLGFPFALQPRSLDDWAAQLAMALQRKQVAAAESRRWRLARIEAAAAGGRLLPPSSAERQQLRRWRQQRCFAVVLAEAAGEWGAEELAEDYGDEECGGIGVDGDGDISSSGRWQQQQQPLSPRRQQQRQRRQLLGCAAVSLARPEAALPPPWPTAAPRRAYLSNLAVAPQHRRRGVAAQLVRQAERVAAAWRYDALWLHAEVANTPAVQLYRKQGYEEVQREPAAAAAVAVWAPLARRPRCLIMRRLVAEAGGGTGNSSGGGTGSDRRGELMAAMSAAEGAWLEAGKVDGSEGEGSAVGGGEGSSGGKAASGTYDWSRVVDPWQ